MKKIRVLSAILPLMAAMIMIIVASCKKENDPQTVTDIDGNVYKTVVIGNQTWMAEDLKTTKFKDGSVIPNVANDNEWITLAAPGMCWYDNNPANKEIYGGMYNWYAANNSKLCPTGWHVPSDNEWKQLEMNIGMTQTEADETGFRGTDEGGKLKEKGTTHWEAPNTGATNETGFTGLPGGYRNKYGSFGYIGKEVYWWSSTAESDTDGWERGLVTNASTIDRIGSKKIDGFYIRCIKD